MSSVCYRDGRFNVTEYTDSVTEGFSARLFVYRPNSRFAYRKWFFKRPGKRALELPCHDHPTDARETLKLLLAGDETTITGAYLANEDSDAHDCQCFRALELLQEKTLRELEKEVASNEDFSRCCRIRHIKAALKRYAIFREREGLEIKIKAKPKKREEDWCN